MKILVVGGDRRMDHVARLLSDDGYESIRCENGYSAEADVIILPHPCVREGKINGTDITAEEFFGTVGESTVVIGGGTENGKNRFDYAEDEAFLLDNARITAEGAVMIAMQSTEKTLYGAKATVFGYGRIGKFLCALLKNVGCEVTAVARRAESRAVAKGNGLISLSFENTEEAIKNADFIFNTVPHVILGKKELRAIGNGVPYIELASKPYGLDMSLASDIGINVILAPSLPGRYAPQTAGKIIHSAAVKILKGSEERG